MFDANQTWQAIGATTNEREPVVDLIEGFAVGWVLGKLIKRLAK